MEFRILGPLEVLDGDRPVWIRGAKERALLAFLLLHANELVTSDRLIDELWGPDASESARSSLHVRVANLRKALGAPPRTSSLVVSLQSGYQIRLEPDQLDLIRFERLLAEGQEALTNHDPREASEKLQAALALWRGPALADFALESFTPTATARLDELRIGAIEKRIDAELQLGHHTELISELEAVVEQHPFRERIQAQRMLALYRSGRQAEALDAYRNARRMFVQELGIEPGSILQNLEKAILRHDPSLDPPQLPSPDRSILIASMDARHLDYSLQLAEALAHRPRHELIIVYPTAVEGGLADAASLLNQRRKKLLARGLVARAAAFTSTAPGVDVARVASELDVDLLLFDGPPDILNDTALLAALARAPCDTAIVAGRDRPAPHGPVLVPFTGAEHDWAAVELGAWIARAQRARLKLAGAEADPTTGTRDASRLLAHASLAVQRTLGVTAESVLLTPSIDELVRAADAAALVILGVPPRWRQEGLGEVRLALARCARPPTLLVRRGLRPGGLTPPEGLTQFTWSLGPS
jgi:DNA-binding SARP family transcriptional activator